MWLQSSSKQLMCVCVCTYTFFCLKQATSLLPGNFKQFTNHFQCFSCDLTQILLSEIKMTIKINGLILQYKASTETSAAQQSVNQRAACGMKPWIHACWHPIADNKSRMRQFEEKQRRGEKKIRRCGCLGIDPSKTHSASPQRMHRDERKRMTYEDTKLERDVSTLW